MTKMRKGVRLYLEVHLSNGDYVWGYIDAMSACRAEAYFIQSLVARGWVRLDQNNGDWTVLYAPNVVSHSIKDTTEIELEEIEE